jgi:hypothetical protein
VALTEALDRTCLSAATRPKRSRDSWRKTTMEVCVGNLNSLGSLGRAVLLSCGVALVACVLPAIAGAAAVTPRSLTECGGKVSANPSGAAADEPNLLTYRFSCDGGITAYTILIQQQGDPGGSIDDYDPAPSVFETDGVTPSPTESITCEGSTPSDGINCNTGTQGVQLTNEFAVQGSVDPIQAYCKHLPTNASGKTAKPGTPAVPQAVVQLVVTDFTGAEDGPFNLGPTKACPKVPNVVPTPKPKPKPKKKHKASVKKHA